MKNKILCYLFYFIARLLKATYRYRYAGVENLLAAQKAHPKGAFCLASWHEHALAGVLGQAGRPYAFLISPSRDGEFVAFLSQRFGFRPVRGSSSRGGKEARYLMEESVRQGLPAAFTVDGPRGPRRQCKAGVLSTALNTRSVILPVAAVAAKPWVMWKSWDKTKLPKPFAKILYQFGPIIELPPELEGEAFEAMLAHIGQKLDATEAMAEKNLSAWEQANARLPE